MSPSAAVLPFTRDQFIAVFAGYNVDVWPVQIVAYLLGLAMVAALFAPWRARDQLIGSGLAAMWLWTGAVYHWLYFAPVNPAAWAFGALFVLQAAALLFAALFKARLKFGRAAGPAAWLGWSLLLYAAILYPLVGLWAGHSYPGIPTFGITPCPVTIFSLGLLLTTTPVPRWLLVVPLLWSLIGGSAAFLLGIPQDWLLPVSGVAAALVAMRNRASKPGS